MGEIVPAEEWQWTDVPVIINRQCVVDEVRAQGLVSRITPTFAKVVKPAEDWVYVEWLQQAIDTIQVIGLDTVRLANAEWFESLAEKAQTMSGYRRFSQVLANKNTQAGLDAFQTFGAQIPLATSRDSGPGRVGQGCRSLPTVAISGIIEGKPGNSLPGTAGAQKAHTSASTGHSQDLSGGCRPDGPVLSPTGRSQVLLAQ